MGNLPTGATQYYGQFTTADLAIHSPKWTIEDANIALPLLVTEILMEMATGSMNAPEPLGCSASPGKMAEGAVHGWFGVGSRLDWWGQFEGSSGRL